jgi:prephenate dehydrogenase
MSKLRVGIIGLGLMGGSFALALKKKYKDREQKVEVIGIDHNDQHCLEALELKIADKITDDISDLYNLDLIVLTIPVNGILKILPELKGVSKNTTIVDFGSTKEKIVEAIPNEIRENFVAAHPMTGTEKFGPKAADRKLYRGKVVVFCDTEKNSKEHLKFAKNIFRDIGMKIFYMNAKEHDKHAAFISHMPHAVSYALANSVMKQENPKAILALAGGGFRDMSRIAKSSPNMWIDIFKQNKSNLQDAIKSFKEELNILENAINSNDWESATEWILKANKLHDVL